MKSRPMNPHRPSALVPPKAAPSAEEVAARPELLKQMLRTIEAQVDPMDLEMALVLARTTDGAIRLFHSYGRDLPPKEVAQLLTDAALAARRMK